jgi:hypothetical protein
LEVEAQEGPTEDNFLAVKVDEAEEGVVEMVVVVMVTRHITDQTA